MLTSKVALVTGGSRGIGKATALELQKLGATVVATSTSEAGADQVTQLLSKEKPEGKGIKLDVTHFDQVTQVFDMIISCYGSIDILVNNAGITSDSLMLRMKEEAWDKVMLTNLTAAQRLTKQALKFMIKNRWGRIINISSVVGVIGNAGQANYAATKAGIIAFGKSLAREVASRHITVNAVAPGFIETDMTDKLNDKHKQAINHLVPCKRMGTPQEVASAVGFLALPSSAYITGQTLHVNGGMAMI